MNAEEARERAGFEGLVLLHPDGDALRALRKEFPGWDIQPYGKVYTSLRRTGTVEEFHAAPTVAALAAKLRGAP